MCTTYVLHLIKHFGMIILKLWDHISWNLRLGNVFILFLDDFRFFRVEILEICTEIRLKLESTSPNIRKYQCNIPRFVFSFALRFYGGEVHENEVPPKNVFA